MDNAMVPQNATADVRPAPDTLPKPPNRRPPPPADPRLDPEPSARDEAPQDRGDVRAEDAERSTREHGEGNAVARAGVRIQGDAQQHDDIAQHARPDGCLPGPSLVDQARGQRVSRDADRHPDPQRCDVPPVPGAPVRRYRKQIFVRQLGPRRKRHFTSASARSIRLQPSSISDLLINMEGAMRITLP